MLETVKQLTGGLESDRQSLEAERNKAKDTGERNDLGPATHTPSAG